MRTYKKKKEVKEILQNNFLTNLKQCFLFPKIIHSNFCTGEFFLQGKVFIAESVNGPFMSANDTWNASNIKKLINDPIIFDFFQNSWTT